MHAYLSIATNISSLVFATRIKLPKTLSFLRKALVQRIYPLLRSQFATFLPPGEAPLKLRVADGFIVKYDAEGGQAELKPHRDGSVFSFNIALNPADDFEGGGTWFNSLGDLWYLVVYLHHQLSSSLRRTFV